MHEQGNAMRQVLSFCGTHLLTLSLVAELREPLPAFSTSYRRCAHCYRSRAETPVLRAMAASRFLRRSICTSIGHTRMQYSDLKGQVGQRRSLQDGSTKSSTGY